MSKHDPRFGKLRSHPYMKAIALTRYLPITDPQALFDTELPKPEPSGHDLLV